MTLIVFMVLGANIPFAELGENLLPALAVLATLMLVARPITVFACAMPDRAARWTRNELAFLCWTRETGVVPAALVGVLAGLGVPEGDVFASVVALAIVLTLLLQALPARWLAGPPGPARAARRGRCAVKRRRPECPPRSSRWRRCHSPVLHALAGSRVARQPEAVAGKSRSPGSARFVVVAGSGARRVAPENLPNGRRVRHRTC